MALSPTLRLEALRRGVLLREKPGISSEEIAAAAFVEFSALGFKTPLGKLKTVSPEELQATLEAARQLVGADRDLKPVYPGFPQQVKDLSTITLLVEQILHYWSGGAFLPNHPTVLRPGLPLEDVTTTPKTLEIKSLRSYAPKAFQETLGKASGLSESDRTLVKELYPYAKADLPTLGKSLTQGENFQSLAAAALPSLGGAKVFQTLAPVTSNSDQLLRLVLTAFGRPSREELRGAAQGVTTTLRGRPTTLAFASLPKASRRLLVARLGELSSGEEADRLVAHRDLWQRVLTGVHPYALKLTPEARRALDIIHQNVPYATFNSRVETLLAQGKVLEVFELLSSKPGNLLRRTVSLLTLLEGDSLGTARALEILKEAAPRAQTTTLIGAYNALSNAGDGLPHLVRIPGKRNFIYTPKDRGGLSQMTQKRALEILEDSLMFRLKETDTPEGPVAVGGNTPLRLYTRDASAGDRTLLRGTTVPLQENGTILRLFGHWNNNQEKSGYMDIGAVLLNQSFEVLSTCDWATWLQSRRWATYSGDKLVAPGNSAAEYIDVDLDKVKQFYPSATWVALSVESWSGFPVKEVDFMAGAMVRSAGDAGEVFDPRTLTTVFKPTTPSLQAIPLAVNLETRTLHWLDTSSGSVSPGVSVSRDKGVAPLLFEELGRKALTWGRFGELWAEAHGVATTDSPADPELLGKLL